MASGARQERSAEEKQRAETSSQLCNPSAWINARSEAQPFTWDDLALEQRRVICLVQRWMEDFVEHTPLTPLPPDGAFTWQAADLQRRSNVLLIHGGRGSGKTSVMLTLLELWRQPLVSEPRQGSRRTLAPEEQRGRDSASLEQEALTQTNLSTVDAKVNTQLTRGRVIPLKPLDLQPLPGPTSLLAWIASRIREFAELLDQPFPGTPYTRPPRAIAGWHPDTENEAPWRKPWRELADAIALGWEINPRQRQGGLDPEAFTEEMLEAERSRHAILVKWRRFVEAVVAHACWRSPSHFNQQARLVLPIDDVDMNPRQCVHVLELVRYLWHPQLVFLLTGQSRLFTKMLRLSYHGAMRAGLGPGSVNDHEFESLDARPSPHELAAQDFDRIIPPAQRFRLNPIEPAERRSSLLKWLRLQPEASPPPSQEPTETKERTVPRDSLLARFLDRFRTTPFLQNGLPPHFRQLCNVEQLLLRAHLEEKTQSEMVALLWKEAVEDKTFSRASDQGVHGTVQLQRIPKSVEPVIPLDTASPAPGRQGATYKLHVTVGRTERPGGAIESRVFPVGTFRVPLGTNEVRFDVGVTRGFAWYTGKNSSREQSEYLTALLLLAMDVAVEERGLLEGAFQMNGLLAPYVRVTVPVWLKSGGKIQVPFCWPTPDWVGTSRPQAFSQIWEDGLRRLTPANLSSSHLKELSDTFRTGIIQSSTQPDSPRGDASQEASVQRWLEVRQYLLATPESGLTPTVAAELLADIAFQKRQLKVTGMKLSDSQKVTLYRVRLERARLALANLSAETRASLREELTPGNLLAYIDDQLGGKDYPLVNAIGDEPLGSGFITASPSARPSPPDARPPSSDTQSH